MYAAISSCSPGIPSGPPNVAWTTWFWSSTWDNSCSSMSADTFDVGGLTPCPHDTIPLTISSAPPTPIGSGITRPPSYLARAAAVGGNRPTHSLQSSALPSARSRCVTSHPGRPKSFAHALFEYEQGICKNRDARWTSSKGIPNWKVSMLVENEDDPER